MPKRRTQKPVSLDAVRCSMSTALRELENIYLDDKHAPDIRIKAVNSLASLVNSYTKLTEATELEQRIAALETQKL